MLKSQYSNLMIFSKKKFLFLIFLNLSVLLFSHNPIVRSLELNYRRKENGQVLQGSVAYKTGVSLDDEELAADFLVWFMNDFGLQEAGYKIHHVEKTEEGFCSVYTDEEYYEEGFVKLFFNHKNECIRFCIYEEEELIAQTKLESYEYQKGFKYPTVIVTDFFEGEEKVSRVELTLGGVKLNEGIKRLAGDVKTYPVYFEETEDCNNYEKSLPAAYKDYEVSTASILVHCAFDFYKKFITDQDVPGCAYTPSCSAYMVKAVSSYGVLGVIKGLDRLKRCNRSETRRNIYIRNDSGLIMESE